MAEKKYKCKKCGAQFVAKAEQGEPLDCSECGSDQIERFVEALYSNDYDDVKKSVDAFRKPKE